MASAEPATAATVRVEVVFCPEPGVCRRVLMDLPGGSTAGQALRDSGLLPGLGMDEPIDAALARQGLSLGVWCRAAMASQPLRDLDRVELHRGLLVDPKEARRQRYKRQRAER